MGEVCGDRRGGSEDAMSEDHARAGTGGAGKLLTISEAAARLGGQQEDAARLGGSRLYPGTSRRRRTTGCSSRPRSRSSWRKMRVEPTGKLAA